LTGESSFRQVVEEIFAWLEREMTSPEGPFYSTLDADSEGVEGKYYVWTAKDIASVLGAADAELFNDCYGVVPGGNWADPHAPREPKNVLHLVRPIEEVAREHGLTESRLRDFLADCRSRLLAARDKRVRPGLDDKCLTAWNGLMITALATA